MRSLRFALLLAFFVPSLVTPVAAKEDWQSDSDPSDRLGKGMADRGDAKNRDQAASTKPVLRQEIDREQSRNNRAADIHREDDLGRFDQRRHDITHAEEGHLTLGHHDFLAERGDGYVDVAAEERGEEQEEGRA